MVDGYIGVCEATLNSAISVSYHLELLIVIKKLLKIYNLFYLDKTNI